MEPDEHGIFEIRIEAGSWHAALGHVFDAVSASGMMTTSPLPSTLGCRSTIATALDGHRPKPRVDSVIPVMPVDADSQMSSMSAGLVLAVAT